MFILINKCKWFFLSCFLIPSLAFPFEFPPERTKREADKELGWMFAPLPGCVEGVGCAVPIAGLISNFYKSTDLVILKTLAKGDIEATVVQLQKFPIIEEKLLLKVLYYDWDISLLNYDRGIHSGKNDYYQTFENSILERKIRKEERTGEKQKEQKKNKKD